MSTVRVEQGADGVALVWIDLTDRPDDLLTGALEAELGAALQRLAAEPDIRGIVLGATRPDAFVAGDDVAELATAYGRDDRAAALARSTRLTALLRHLETSGKPVAAAIRGPTLGAGLDLALACHYRVLADEPRACVGFPDVHAGLLPRGGGAQRLARLIGTANALPLLLTGESLAPSAALQQGLVHAVVPTDRVVAVARAWVLAHPDARQPWDAKGFVVPGGVGCLAPHAIESFQFGTSRTMRATQRNYPAPIAILSAVFEGTQVPFETGVRLDAKRYALLLTDPVSRNLMRTMLLGRQAADALVRRPPAVPKTTVRRLGVIGAGLMGAGIAYVAADAGIEVVLIDATAAQAEHGRQYAAERLARRQASGQIDATRADAVLRRITPAVAYEALTGCEMVIEAVFEQAALKCEVVAQAATFVGRNAIIASNTSTLSISELARACPQQARFVGIHFFSPVERMPLVEVIRGKRTDAAALAMALDLAAQLGKTPIVVNDSPGFFTSRVFGAFVDEGMAMLTEGVEPAAIENAARMAGMPVGPLAVCDEVSIELQLRVHEAAVASRLPERFQRLTAIEVVRAMIARDRSGRRAGAGFYDYPPGERKRLWPGLRELFPVAATQPPVTELRSRFLVIQALETVRCVEEGVIDATLDADVGSILGIGYPSWTGGTLSYIDTLGLPAFLAACDALVRKVGARFRPSRAFRARAAAGHGFHGPEALR